MNVSRKRSVLSTPESIKRAVPITGSEGCWHRRSGRGQLACKCHFNEKVGCTIELRLSLRRNGSRGCCRLLNIELFLLSTKKSMEKSAVKEAFSEAKKGFACRSAEKRASSASILWHNALSRQEYTDRPLAQRIVDTSSA